ncbi:hypothetical protein B0H17DRAFT_955056, partial [Mycena rosella]
LCTKCFPPVPIKTSNYQRILEHNGARILFDKTILALDQPCGLCLRPFPMCTFTFLKSDGTASARQIDWTRSTCLNPVKFQMAAAMKSTKLSPCTNHLIPCPLQCGVVIWTYNILGHCRSAAHNLKSLDNVPVVYQMGVDERGGVLKIWEKRQVYSIPRNMTKAKPKLVLPISDAHRALMVLR